jgi:hypothetical protein
MTAPTCNVTVFGDSTLQDANSTNDVTKYGGVYGDPTGLLGFTDGWSVAQRLAAGVGKPFTVYNASIGGTTSAQQLAALLTSVPPGIKAFAKNLVMLGPGLNDVAETGEVGKRVNYDGVNLRNSGFVFAQFCANLRAECLTIESWGLGITIVLYTFTPPDATTSPFASVPGAGTPLYLACNAFVRSWAQQRGYVVADCASDARFTNPDYHAEGIGGGQTFDTFPHLAANIKPGAADQTHSGQSLQAAYLADAVLRAQGFNPSGISLA